MDNLPLRVRFAAVARIVVCSQGASGRESPDRPAAEKSRREISAKATNDVEVARMVLESMPGYGDKIEL